MEDRTSTAEARGQQGDACVSSRVRQNLADSIATQQCPGRTDGWKDGCVYGGVVTEEVGRNGECEKEKSDTHTAIDAEKSCRSAEWVGFI